MTKKTDARFDIQTIRKLAGDRSFDRGKAYYRDDQVTILSMATDCVLAEVTGAESYRVELFGQGRTIDGSCTCRAFEDYGFCKHMVATALAANASGSDGARGDDALDRIRRHLRELGTDALVVMIVELAKRDLNLFHRLEAAASVVHADDKTLEASLRKAIDQATRTGGYLEYREVAGWASRVRPVLDTISGLVSGARAGLRSALSSMRFAASRRRSRVSTIPTAMAARCWIAPKRFILRPSARSALTR